MPHQFLMSLLDSVIASTKTGKNACWTSCLLLIEWSVHVLAMFNYPLLNHCWTLLLFCWMSIVRAVVAVLGLQYLLSIPGVKEYRKGPFCRPLMWEQAAFQWRFIHCVKHHRHEPGQHLLSATSPSGWASQLLLFLLFLLFLLLLLFLIFFLLWCWSKIAVIIVLCNWSSAGQFKTQWCGYACLSVISPLSVVSPVSVVSPLSSMPLLSVM